MDKIRGSRNRRGSTVKSERTVRKLLFVNGGRLQHYELRVRGFAYRARAVVVCVAQALIFTGKRHPLEVFLG